VVEDGFNGIAHLKKNAEEPEGDEDLSLDELLGDSIEIPLVTLYADAEGNEHPLRLTHHLRFPTATDSLKWDRCYIERRGKGKQRVKLIHSRIESLYDEMVQSL